MTAQELRRHLHRYPELSFEEQATAAYISSALSQYGIEHRSIAKTGLLCKIEGKGDLKRAVVLRADIDALPVTEATGLAYSSENEGVMHACGHDIHAGALFGALCRLNETKDFEGTIFGVFQPGEERNPGGASYVLAEEPFEGYDVVAVVGQHVEGTFEVGRLGFREGKYMASSDELRFTVCGVGGHGAMRHKIKDPVQAGADLLLQLVALNKDELVLSIGKVVADGATNVIPESVYLEGTMRTFDEAERAATKQRINELAREVEAKYSGITVNVDISHGFPCVVNDPKLTALARELAAEKYSVEALELRTTSEDFGFYTTRYPSLFYRLGAGPDVGAPHTAVFSPHEEAIDVGIDFMEAIAKKISKSHKR
ncbi:MAG: M20 family metallopeptidase [Rikenellaceae bacterium]